MCLNPLKASDFEVFFWEKKNSHQSQKMQKELSRKNGEIRTRIRIHSSISVLNNPYPYAVASLLFGQKIVRPVSHYP